MSFSTSKGSCLDREVILEAIGDPQRLSEGYWLGVVDQTLTREKKWIEGPIGQAKLGEK